MYKQSFFIAHFLIMVSFTSWSQQAAISGKWLTPDKDIIEFYSEGQTITARQISTETVKDKKYDNKIVAKDLKPLNEKVFEGTVIDPKNDKFYHGRFTINKSGTLLELKVKWGFLNFNET
ncbi:MAG: DUF2147 domain-containing protein [Bacteroidota bacterium]|nr:DUF2147 domain-containing protein [Bacteroidota bacterium]